MYTVHNSIYFGDFGKLFLLWGNGKLKVYLIIIYFDKSWIALVTYLVIVLIH